MGLSSVFTSKNVKPLVLTPITQQQYQASASQGYQPLYTPAQIQDIRYSLQTYQTYQTYNPTPQQRASPPTTPTPTVTTQRPGTPIIQGKNVSYQKVSDIGAIGDHKTVQMPDGSYRDYVRTGTNTYQYTEVRAADKATVTAKSDAKGAIQVTKVTPSASASPSLSVSTAPLVLYQVPERQTITTSDIPTVGSVTQVTKPDGGYISYKRVSPTQIQYQEYSKAGQITTPWTSIYEETPTVAPAAKLTPAATSPPAATRPASLPLPDLKKGITGDDIPNIGDKKVDHIYSDKDREVERVSSTTIRYRFKDLYTGVYSDWKSLPSNAPGFMAAPAAPIKTQIASSSKKDKPDFSVIIKEDPVSVVQEAEEGQSGGDTASSVDEETTEPPGTYEQFSTTHPGAIDVVENGTGKILRSYYPDTGKDVTESDTTFAGVDKTKLLYPDLDGSKERDESAIENAMEEAAESKIEDPISRSSEIPGTIPVSSSPSVDPTQIAVSGEALPFKYQKPDGFADDAPAENSEQLDYVFAESLAEYNPSGNKNGDNIAIAEHYAGLVPNIIQGEIDPHKLASLVHSYEDYRDGATSGSRKVYVPGSGYVGESVQNPFNELSLEDQKTAIQDLISKSAELEVPVGYSLPLINELIQTCEREDRKRDLIGYIKNGTLEKDLRAFGKGSPIAKIMGWATSDEGLLTIGAAFGFVSTAAAFIAAGPVAGLGALGMSEFQTTELKQNMTSSIWIDQAKLANKNLKSTDRFQAYNRMFSTTYDAVNDFGRYYKDYDEPTRKQKLAELKEIVKDQGTLLRQETVFLADMGIYPSELERWKSLNNSIDNYEKMVDPLTGVLTGLKSVPAVLRIKPPEGGKVVGPDFTHGGDNFFDQTLSDQGSTSVKIYDKNGNLVKTEEITYYPGNVITKDYSNLLAFESTKGGSGSDKVTTGKTTVYLPPGVSFTYEGKKYTGGAGGTTYDINRQSGAPLRLEFTAPGKKPLIEYIGFPEAGWNSYAAPPDLKGDTSEPANYEGFIVPLYEGQKIYINGLEANKYLSEDNYLAVPYGAGKYDVRIVNPDGSTAYHNPDEYVSDGKMTALPLTMGEDPKQPYQKQSYGGGGGGGGGYSGGGGGGGSMQQSAPEPETLIIYGPTCKDAEIWQDEIQVYPEIDEPYSISPGYHSIKAIREGFKPWLKTVYCASGDSITVSPAFEPLESSGEPTEPVDSIFPKRVFINSDPSGGLVLVNGSSSGEWTPCYLDLPEGYYTFTIKKSGYDPYDILCYVGEVIAWNNQAIELATSRGWI